jgi:hypothetical protein
LTRPEEEPEEEEEVEVAELKHHSWMHWKDCKQPESACVSLIRITILSHVRDCRWGLDWWLDLLTTYTHTL